MRLINIVLSAISTAIGIAAFLVALGMGAFVLLVWYQMMIGNNPFQ